MNKNKIRNDFKRFDMGFFAEYNSVTIKSLKMIENHFYDVITNYFDY
jgi:hypothetical protein